MSQHGLVMIEGVRYRVQFVREDMVRLRVRREGEFRPDENEMVIVSPLPDLGITRSASGTELMLSSGSVAMGLDKATGRFVLRDAAGRPVAQTLAAPGWEPLSLSLNLQANEHIYGLGMSSVARPVDQRGEVVNTWLDVFKDDYRTPYYWSSAGYSLFVRTGRAACFDVGRGQPGEVRITVPAEDELECFIQLGSARKCIEGYTWLTGRPPILPDWVFGNWIGGYWKTQEKLLAVALDLRRRGIPMDVMHLDSWWVRGHECDFSWDNNFPHPEDMLEELRGLNLKLRLWLAHVVNYNCVNFTEALGRDVFLKNRDGSVPLIKWWKEDRGATIDFTSPEACKWWKERIHSLARSGVAGVKIDGGCDAYFVTPDRLCADGRTGEQAHNIYPVLYAQCTAEALKEATGQDLPIWIRGGYTGIQRYPVLWAGDQEPNWEGIHVQVRAGISAGLSGVGLWSCDGGGFPPPESEEVYIRGTQFAFWNPVCQPFGEDREPWHFSERACEIYRFYAELRNRLNYYIARLAQESSRSGLPIMRAMTLEFPDDPVCATLEDQYMFGSAFLVAPVYDPCSEREVYLPAGEWHDIHFGRMYEGGRRVRIKTDIRTIPVFARCGVIVPVKPLTQFIVEKDDSILSLFRWQGTHPISCYLEFTTGDPLPDLAGNAADEAIVEAYTRREGRRVEIYPFNHRLCTVPI